MPLRRTWPFVLLLPFAAGAYAAPAATDALPSAATPLAPRHATPCVDGMAGIYPCSNIDLLAFVPLAQFDADSTNSLWGWTDAQSGIEYALVGADNGTAFFDLSTPDHPLYLGKLPRTPAPAVRPGATCAYTATAPTSSATPIPATACRCST